MSLSKQQLEEMRIELRVNIEGRVFYACSDCGTEFVVDHRCKHGKIEEFVCQSEDEEWENVWSE